MSLIYASPPVIPPLAPDVVRPRWSVMIPVYNCARYLTDTLESVLIQCFPEADMQIEVIDDASTDADVEALVKQVGRGRIGYFRQPENGGSLRNFETCINRSRGSLIHILHGDDRIRAGFYQSLDTLFRQYPDAGAAFSGYTYIDEAGNKIFDQESETDHKGILQDWLPKIAERNHIQYVAVAVRREVYERLGGFYGVTYGEDWEMWARIARHYPVAYTPELLAEYRKHTNSISGNKIRTGQYLDDLIRIMNLNQEHLPVESRRAVLRKSKRFYAHYALRMANQVWQLSGDRAGAQVNMYKALDLYTDVPLLWKAAKLRLKMLLPVR